MRQVHAPVLSCTELMPGTYLVWINAPDIASEARPGQFVTIRVGEGTNHQLRRPFSIHMTSEQGLAILFNVVGDGTRWLAGLDKGDMLDILGPLGNGFTILPDARNLLLAAGGIGIAPLIALANEAAWNGQSVKLIHGVKSSPSLYPEEMLGCDVAFLPVTEDGSSGARGMITDLLPKHMKWADQIFACGPVSMYRSMVAQDSNPDRKSIQVLLEQVMGCGVGACHGCTIKTVDGSRLVCQDGPAFELANIIWEGENDAPAASI